MRTRAMTKAMRDLYADTMNQSMTVDATWLHAFLRERLAGEPEDVRPLTGGTFSRAFACAVAGRPYVIRLSALPDALEGFAKDDYAGRHFASPSVPIPRSIDIGCAGNLFFAISERVAGKTVAELEPPARRALLPAVLDTLDALGRTDMCASGGYGPWDGAGRGRFSTWRAFLVGHALRADEKFGRAVRALGGDPDEERALYAAACGRMLRLADHCPEERALLHRDYNFANILTDGQRVTGVIDWAQACYGDPLYDVAWLGWWTAGGSPAERAARYDATIVGARYGAAPQYAERIACYEYCLALDELRFCAETGDAEGYAWARAQLLVRLSP